jgi:hypothetical protein
MQRGTTAGVEKSRRSTESNQEDTDVKTDEQGIGPNGSTGPTAYRPDCEKEPLVARVQLTALDGRCMWTKPFWKNFTQEISRNENGQKV